MLKEALSKMAEVFSPALLMRGQDYQQKGFVLSLKLSDGLLKSRVKGSSNHIYDVHIDLKNWPKVSAHCSCPYTKDCKHAAASLFALQVREHYPTHNFDAWLNNLRQVEMEKNKPLPDYVVIYLIKIEFQKVLVNLALAKRLKKGNLGRKNVFYTLTEKRKQYFKPEDEEIVSALLFKNERQDHFHSLFVPSAELLAKIVTTGRAFFCEEEEETESPLTLAQAREAMLHWKLEPNGDQRLELTTDDDLLFFEDEIWFFDPNVYSVGPLLSSFSPAQLSYLMEAPTVSLEEAPLLSEKLEKEYPHLPKLHVFEEKLVQTVLPQPILQFDVLGDFFPIFTVALLFDYQGVKVSKEEAASQVFQMKENRLYEMTRDNQFEQAKARELKSILKLRKARPNEQIFSDVDLSNAQILAKYEDEDDLEELYQKEIPLLKQSGFRIEFLHPAYEEIIKADELEWFSELDDQGSDFFSYQLGILIDGKPVSVVPLVAELISNLGKEDIDQFDDEDEVKLPLPDGKALILSLGRIKPLIRFLLQYGLRYVKSDSALRINRFQLILMQEMESAMQAVSARWQGGEIIREQLKHLANLGSIPNISLPQGLQTILRDYQQEGLNWLQFLRQSSFGGVLADDMGLGKTVQTLAHLQVEKEAGRLHKASLIVAPTSLVFNWFEEAKRFTPELKVLVFHGLERHQDNFDDYHLVISTYGLIQRDKTRFVEYPFYYLILDEAQSIKNARTKTTQIIQQIQANHRLCLSGTPLENHLGELWSLYHFLMPGLLGDAKQFRQFFKAPIEKENDVERKKLLANRVKPFLLRRSKNEVAKELPAKTETKLIVELTGTQRDLYEAIRMSMEKKVREAIAAQGMGKSHIVLLDALLKLRQVCCDPHLLSIPEAEIAHGTSVKRDALFELLHSLMEEGRRVLIFSQFTAMLALIETELKQHHYPYLKLTGKTKNRQALVNDFQAGKAPIFLISLKAGGTGLNLTNADTVIHYDPWWNPAVEDQATDRSHRIGQENPVFVYKLITAGTVEEAILKMQEKKRQLFEGILSDKANALVGLTKQDIEAFFMPLSEV